MDEWKLELVGGSHIDKRFRALALNPSLKPFGKAFELKGKAPPGEGARNRDRW